jgi:hypothetical protein
MRFEDYSELTSAQWGAIDQLLKAGNRVKAVSEFRRLSGASADKALDVISLREKGLVKKGGGMEFF